MQQIEDINLVSPDYRGARQFHMQGRMTEAEAGYNAALDKAPEDPLLLFYYGTLAMQTKRYGLGVCLLVRSVELCQTVPEAFNNLGMCLKNAGRIHEAKLAFERSIRIRPEADYWNNIASLLVNNGASERCIDACDETLRLQPDHPQGHWNRSLALLELGRWAEGWDEYKWGYRALGRANRQYDAPPWNGNHVGTLCVFGEQGVGDEIMFASVLHEAYTRCDKLIIDCHPRLVEMFKRSFPNADVYGTRKQSEVNWFWKYRSIDAKCSIADLPRLFRRTDGAFPGTPYIVTDPNRDSMAKAWLSTLPGPYKIGISWQGGTAKTHMEFRSIAPPHLRPVLKVDGVTWINLQYGEMTQKIATAIEEDVGVKIHTNEPLIHDLDNLTSIAKMCDLVITVDQTLVWQCGAIGAECWVLLPHRTSWRFPHRFGTRTPWGNSIDLIRQGPDNLWQPVIEEAARRLRERIGVDADQRFLSAAQ